MNLDDVTIGDLADAVLELRRLRAQVVELQDANTREVERKRQVIEAARYVLASIDGFEGIKDRLRHAINACPKCGAVEPCRTDNVKAALPVQHAERRQAP